MKTGVFYIMKALVVRKCFVYMYVTDGPFGSGWHIVAVFGYYVLFVCLFVCLFIFFSNMAPEKNPEGRKTELTTKKDCELVNKTIVGA